MGSLMFQAIMDWIRWKHTKLASVIHSSFGCQKRDVFCDLISGELLLLIFWLPEFKMPRLSGHSRGFVCFSAKDGARISGRDADRHDPERDPQRPRVPAL